MCQNHTGNTITQEDLNALAVLAGYTLPTPAQLEGTVLPQGWTIVPGEIPAPYEAELYAGISDAEGGEGTRRRSTTGENGRSRNLLFPPAPEPLPYPIVDNHTHMDLLDGEVEISARDALDTGEKLGIGAIVQVGCDVPSSLYAVAAAQADERVLAAVAIHPNTAPELAQAGTLDEALATLDRLAATDRVRAIALTEERELRAWLYTGHAQAADSLDAAVTEAVVGVESRYGVPISVVVVGDMRPGPGELALVAALAEACQNAVRHGAPPVSVYVEVRPQAVEAYIKDGGEGFDPATIAADRHGVRDSIVGRMRRAGGHATIRRLARGTEVALSVPRSDILEETAPNGRTQ